VSPVIQQLDAAVDLSRQMKRHAQSGEWEDLTELELKRRELILGSFKDPVPESDAIKAKKAIEAILSLDKIIHNMSVEERDRLSGELKGMNKNRRAAGAYTANA
jgi:hypothetical protein